MKRNFVMKFLIIKWKILPLSKYFLVFLHSCLISFYSRDGLEHINSKLELFWSLSIEIKRLSRELKYQVNYVVLKKGCRCQYKDRYDTEVSKR